MSVKQVLSRGVRQVQVLAKRNVGISAPALTKASDPIQQLFVTKIREYKQKSRYLVHLFMNFTL
jgi:F-type H+-transporting ATPase subunit 6